jgi:hypothetical protein
MRPLWAKMAYCRNIQLLSGLRLAAILRVWVVLRQGSADDIHLAIAASIIARNATCSYRQQVLAAVFIAAYVRLMTY